MIVLALALFAIELFRNDEQPFQRIAFSLCGIIYVCVPFSLLALYKVENSVDFFCTFAPSSYMILLLFAFTWINDTFAYLTGMLLGKHPLCPKISPKKTIEGFAGGCFFTIVCAAVIAYVYMEGMELHIVGYKLRIDIIDPDNNQIYEVKPLTWSTGYLLKKTTDQVKNYAELGHYELGTKSIEGQIVIPAYIIKYYNFEGSRHIIFYEFENNLQKDLAIDPVMIRNKDGSVSIATDDFFQGVINTGAAIGVTCVLGYAMVGLMARGSGGLKLVCQF